MTRNDHLDSGLPSDVRADLLAQQLTTREKCWQLTALVPWWLVNPDGSDAVSAEDTLANAPQQLAGFARVELDAGQSGRVGFHVAATQLGYTNLARDFAVEPGRVDVFLGFDAHARRLRGAFHLTGDPHVLTSAQRSFLPEVHQHVA